MIIKYRPLTAAERDDIAKAKKMIEFYRTGIALMEMKIEMIENAPQEEYTKRIIAQPLEF